MGLPGVKFDPYKWEVMGRYLELVFGAPTL